MDDVFAFITSLMWQKVQAQSQQWLDVLKRWGKAHGLQLDKQQYLLTTVSLAPELTGDISLSLQEGQVLHPLHPAQIVKILSVNIGSCFSLTHHVQRKCQEVEREACFLCMAMQKSGESVCLKLIKTGVLLTWMCACAASQPCLTSLIGDEDCHMAALPEQDCLEYQAQSCLVWPFQCVSGTWPGTTRRSATCAIS